MSSRRSPVYDRIVQTFLERASEDPGIPDALARSLKLLFDEAVPKKDALVAVFRADEDVK